MISNALIRFRPLISSSLSLSTRLATHSSYSNSNLAFSPLCLQSILGLLTAGSTGRTQQQLLSFLGTKNASELTRFHSQVSNSVLADGSASGGPCLRYVSGVGVDDRPGTTLRKSFREIARSAYRAEARLLPYRSLPEECRNGINEWAERNTAGHIKDLLPPGLLDTDTRMLLGNALYFNGTWDEKFNPMYTKNNIFYTTDGTTIETPFMSSREEQFVSVYDGFKVLKLPFEQGQDQRQFSFNIFLPDTSDGLLDLWIKLSSDPDFINRHIPTEKDILGYFRIPVFKITMDHKLSDILKDLGLALPFATIGSDFSAMVDSPEVSQYHVSEIVHKCFVGVDEEGTETAGPTDRIRIGFSLRFGNLSDFVADHPFLFVIREDTTGVVLFTGHLLNPLASITESYDHTE